MKFQHIHKFLALMLVFLLAAQLTSIAFATSTETWTGSDGAYTAIVSKGVNTTTTIAQIKATEIHHTNGKVEKIQPGTWSVTKDGNMRFPSTYATRLQTAAKREGLKNSHTSSVTRTSAVNIPAASPSGYYCLGTHFNGHTGNYRVEKVSSGAVTIETSGRFDNAPYACVGDTFLYCVSVDG